MRLASKSQYLFAFGAKPFCIKMSNTSFTVVISRYSFLPVVYRKAHIYVHRMHRKLRINIHVNTDETPKTKIEIDCFSICDTLGFVVVTHWVMLV